MTGPHHTLALDRVAEAATKCGFDLNENNITVCVQGDEPMLSPDMITAVVDPLKTNLEIPCTVLGMHITKESIWLNPNTVKIVHNEAGEVLYTSRSPVPYCKGDFIPELGGTPNLWHIRISMEISASFHKSSRNQIRKT